MIMWLSRISGYDAGWSGSQWRTTMKSPWVWSVTNCYLSEYNLGLSDCLVDSLRHVSSIGQILLGCKTLTNKQIQHISPCCFSSSGLIQVFLPVLNHWSFNLNCIRQHRLLKGNNIDRFKKIRSKGLPLMNTHGHWHWYQIADGKLLMGDYW